MFEQLKEWDRELFIYLNGLGIERFDSFWIAVTQEEYWIPLYIIFFILIFIAYKKKTSFYCLYWVSFQFCSHLWFNSFNKSFSCSHQA